MSTLGSIDLRKCGNEGISSQQTGHDTLIITKSSHLLANHLSPRFDVVTGSIHSQQEATASGGCNSVAQRPTYEDRHDGIVVDFAGFQGSCSSKLCQL